MAANPAKQTSALATFLILTFCLGIVMIILQIINRLSGLMTWFLAVPLIIAGIVTSFYGIMGSNKTLAKNCARMAPVAMTAGISTLLLVMFSGPLYTLIRWAAILVVAVLAVRFLVKLFKDEPRSA